MTFDADNIPLVVTPGHGGTKRAAATLLAGFPIAVVQAATDLSNADLVVVSNGATPILLVAQVGLANAGAAVGKVVLSVREGATIIASTAPADVAITTGNTNLNLAAVVVLAAGSHSLKLTVHKTNANGTVTATSGAGDLVDTYLQALTF